MPPDIPGFEHIERIGQGGFADVYLYEQQMPKRRVAVKVLFEVSGKARDLFNAEANVMAQLSSHPSIVPIYNAAISGDGRPYLVMEYCPRANLAARYRSAPLSVPEALQIGIGIAGAVETAHRAGILHRDIKPHNILTNEYGKPKLTDFGIASTTSAVDEDEGAGVSVPWAPPEMFDESPPLDPRTDVYSLAATVYTLLAGRSPFEIAGGANDTHTLIARIGRQALPQLTRADVSDQLFAVISRGMAKSLNDRFVSALAFARAMQEVEISMGLAATTIDVLDATPELLQPAEEDGRTRVRPIAIIRPDTSASTVTSPKPHVASLQPADLGDRTQLRAEPAPKLDFSPSSVVSSDTILRELVQAGVSATPTEEQADPSGPKRSRMLLAGALTVVVMTAVGLAFVLGSPTKDRGGKTLADAAPKADPIAVAEVPPTPTGLTGVVGPKGEVTFTWVNAGPAEGDTYLWQKDGSQRKAPASEPRATFTLTDNSTGCIAVQTVRAGQASAATPMTCPKREAQ